MTDITEQPTQPSATVENEVALAHEAAAAGDVDAQFFHLSNASFMLNTPNGDASQAAAIDAELAAIRAIW